MATSILPHRRGDYVSEPPTRDFAFVV